MELLGQDIFNIWNYELIKEELLNRHINKTNSVSYDDFKELISFYQEPFHLCLLMDRQQ